MNYQNVESITTFQQGLRKMKKNYPNFWNICAISLLMVKLG